MDTSQQDFCYVISSRTLLHLSSLILGTNNVDLSASINISMGVSNGDSRGFCFMHSTKLRDSKLYMSWKKKSAFSMGKNAPGNFPAYVDLRAGVWSWMVLSPSCMYDDGTCLLLLRWKLLARVSMNLRSWIRWWSMLMSEVLHTSNPYVRIGLIRFLWNVFLFPINVALFLLISGCNFFSTALASFLAL